MQTDELINERVDMILSLQDSIKRCGGRHFDWEELKHMTCYELVEKFAQNGIRFCNAETLQSKDQNAKCDKCTLRDGCPQGLARKSNRSCGTNVSRGPM